MASAIKLDSGNIPKFDGNNFQLWKFGITIFLKSENLFDVVTGKESAPEDLNSQEGKAWNKKNSKAQVILISTISQDQMQHLINCENAEQMWKRLMSIHEQRTEISKEMLWQNFYDYRMPDTGSVANHISSIEMLVKKLRDVNETISNTAVCSKVINSLPSKFNAFRTAWDSVAADQQTFENLTARLLKEESRMTKDDTEMSRLALEVQALQAKLTNFESKNKNEKKPIEERKKNSTCNFCKKKGHWARECRKRLAEEKEKEKGKEKDSAKFPKKSSAYVCDVSALMVVSEKIDKCEWICDSGASVHMTSHKEWFSKLETLSEPTQIKIANNKTIAATGKGMIEIEAKVDGKWYDRTINDVLYVPELGRNLFSVGTMTDRQFTHHSYKNHCEFRDNEGEVSCIGKRSNNLWVMQFRVKKSITLECNYSEKTSLKLWHERFGHVNCETIKKTANKNMVKNLNIENNDEFYCESCQFGKQVRKTHKALNRERCKEPGAMIHSDLCGPINIVSPGGSRYFVLFKDDCSSYSTVYFLKNKSEVLEKFKIFKALVENQTGNKIKILRSDQGKGEYLNAAFIDFLKKEGINHELSATYTPQQNGRSERELRTIVESARTMIINKKVPEELWPEAVNTAVYNLNRVASSQINEMTPYEKWFGRKPDVKHMRIFGSAAFMAIPPQFRKKFEPKSRKMLFVGYEGYSSNYRLWDLERRQIQVSCNVNFNEQDTVVIDKKKTSVTLHFGNEDQPEIQENEGQNENDEIAEINNHSSSEEEDFEDAENNRSDEDYEIDSSGSSSGESNIENAVPEQRQLRNRQTLRPPDYYGLMSFCGSIDVPDTYEDAMNTEHSSQWEQAIIEEMDSLKENNTWTLVKQPKSARVIDNKWVFRIKTDCDGNPTRFKARLVARGFNQQKGIDYNETFAPVVRYDSIRILLALAAEKGLKLANFDVKTAFLYGELSEIVYMRQPKGFKDRKRPEWVCKLNKSIYGLKQSPRCWNRKFVSFLDKYKFQQLKSDQCVFIGTFGNAIVYLAIYVDDGLLLSESSDAINELIKILQEEFKITVHLDDNIQFVGLQIEQNLSEGKITIHQENYINKILHKFNMVDSKPLSTPVDPGTHLKTPAEDSQKNQKQPYREAVGSLIFLATCSRPDISYAVSQVSRFLNKWDNEHWKAVKRIFRYLKHTSHIKITYSKGTDQITTSGFTDADYAGCINTRKSTSGYLFLMAKGPITWKSQKQSMVAQSTTEAEYIALSLGVKEALWLKSFLGELQLNIPSVNIGVDNQSAIKLTQAHQFHNRTKHMDVKVYFVRDECKKGNISVKYVSSRNQLADILTKATNKTVLQHILVKLNMF